MALYTFLQSSDTSFGAVYAWAKKLVTDLNRNGAINNSVPVGGTTMWLSDVLPLGWLLCDGKAYVTTDYPNLFNQLQYRYGGSGNEFNVPDFRNRILMGAGTLVGLNATTGSDQVTLGIPELPTHTHVVDDPKHTHAFTADAHTHVVDDPHHTHVLHDPGHHHTGGAGSAGTASAAGTTGPTVPVNTGDAATGITMDAAATGVTNENTIVVGHNADSATGVTNEETGNGNAFSVLNPVFGVNVIIKT